MQSLQCRSGCCLRALGLRPGEGGGDIGAAERGGAELQLEMGGGAGVSLIREEEARLRRVCEVLLCGSHATAGRKEGGGEGYHERM